MKFYVVICFVAFVILPTILAAMDDNMINPNKFEESFLKKLSSKCLQQDNSACIMMKFVTYMNRLLKKSSIKISDTFEIKQSRELGPAIMDKDIEELLPRAMSSDEDSLGVIVTNKLSRFLNSRTFHWKMFSIADAIASIDHGKLNFGVSINTKDAIEEGRTKIKQGIGHLIGGIVVGKLGLLAALLIKGVILLVGKAFILSKIALVLAVITALKKLLTKKMVTYEVVPHPVQNHETHHHHQQPNQHDSYSSGWGRAMNSFVESFVQSSGKNFNAHNIAYSAQK